MQTTNRVRDGETTLALQNIVVFFAWDEIEFSRFTTKNASGIALLTKSVNNLERFTPTRYVSRDNNLYVVGDISRKCLDTTETNNYQVNICRCLRVERSLFPGINMWTRWFNVG